jgi:hypothetical protein
VKPKQDRQDWQTLETGDDWWMTSFTAPVIVWETGQEYSSRAFSITPSDSNLPRGNLANPFHSRISANLPLDAKEAKSRKKRVLRGDSLRWDRGDFQTLRPIHVNECSKYHQRNDQEG